MKKKKSRATEKRMNKRRNTKKLDYGLITRLFTWSVMLLMSIFFVVVILLFNYGVTLRDVRFNATATVINLSSSNITKIGVSVDPDKLVFGIVPLGGNVTREINVKVPSHARKTKIKVLPEGNISRKLRISRSVVFLYPNQSLNVKIKFVGSEEGNYTGTIHVLICTPRYTLAEEFLDVLCDEAFKKWEEEHIKIS